MTDPRKALERIIKLCEKDPKPNHRTCRMYDVAMEGLGMIATQRIQLMRENLGSHAADTFIQRQEQERVEASNRKHKERSHGH